MEAYTQTERIKEEGRRMREEREKALKDAEKAKQREEEERREKEEGLKERGVGGEAMMDVDEPPPLDQFDTTVRLKYSLKSKPDLTSKEAIAEYLAPFGPVDVDSIVFSMKAKKSKSKSKAKDGGGMYSITPTNMGTATDKFGCRIDSVSCHRTGTLQKHIRCLCICNRFFHTFLVSR